MFESQSKTILLFGNIGVLVGREKWLSGFRFHHGPLRFPLGTIHFRVPSLTPSVHTPNVPNPHVSWASVPTRRESDGVGGTHLRTHPTLRRLLTLSIARTSQDNEDWIEFCECPVNERGPNTTKS